MERIATAGISRGSFQHREYAAAQHPQLNDRDRIRGRYQLGGNSAILSADVETGSTGA
jgi:hypothetical protein